MNEYKFKRKLKTIVKNLFLKNNHSKIEIIKNASWIANKKVIIIFTGLVMLFKGLNF